MTDLLFAAGVLFSFAFVGLLLLRWFLVQIVPDDEPDEWIRDAQQGLSEHEKAYGYYLNNVSLTANTVEPDEEEKSL